MATFYIATNGSDSTGDGSEANPWFNLFYAAGNGRSGTSDTIIVKDGTYTQTLGANVFSFTNRHIKSESLDPNSAILDFTGLNTQVISGTSEAKIEGIRFQNMRVTDGSSSRGIFVDFNGEYIKNCIFQGITGSDGPRGRGGSFHKGSTRYQGCVFIDCWSISPSTSDGGIFSSTNDGYDFELVNCTIYFNANNIPVGLFMPLAVIHMGDGGSNRSATVSNTIVLVDGGTISEFAEIRNGNGTVNTTYSCLHNANYSDGETGVITDDPLLVDSVNGDFRLRPTSPCIGTGVL
jgi:hypothetical protein